MFLTCLFLAFAPSDFLELNVHPKSHREPIRFSVHPDYVTLVIFNHVPDAYSIHSSESDWYVSLPPDVPDSQMAFKPKTLEPGLGANSFVFFQGYPLELRYSATGDKAKAVTRIYITVEGLPEKAAVPLDRRAPAIHQRPMAEEPILPTLPLGAKIRNRTLTTGTLRWVTGTSSPWATFQPRPAMAALESIEIVRASKRWGRIKNAQPLSKTFERRAGLFYISFHLVHLDRSEAYYLRTFFKGSRSPQYIRLKGFEKL